MSMKGSGEPTDWREVDRFEHGVGWLAYPDEEMQRASHALVADGDVWVVDPVDVPGLDELLAEFGEVSGVVVLLDRHRRDSAEIANRHDVAVWVPEFMDGVAEDIEAPIERFSHELADSGFAVHKVVNNAFWQEALLFDSDRGILVVPESLGTTDYFRAGSERLGVHPMLRLTPPTRLKRFDPEHILVGHGAGIHEDATIALQEAIDGARSRAPALAVKNVSGMLPF